MKKLLCGKDEYCSRRRRWNGCGRSDGMGRRDGWKGALKATERDGTVQGFSCSQRESLRRRRARNETRSTQRYTAIRSRTDGRRRRQTDGGRTRRTDGRTVQNPERRSVNECVLKIGINSTRGINNRTREQRSAARSRPLQLQQPRGQRRASDRQRAGATATNERLMRRYVGALVRWSVRPRSAPLSRAISAASRPELGSLLVGCYRGAASIYGLLLSVARWRRFRVHTSLMRSSPLASRTSRWIGRHGNTQSETLDAVPMI
jgi:hypothetical protein